MPGSPPPVASLPLGVLLYLASLPPWEGAAAAAYNTETLPAVFWGWRRPRVPRHLLDGLRAMSLPVDESYRLLAARYVRKQAKQLAAQLQGARKAEDPERIHQARVASRRLRAAMRMFGDCFSAKQVKRWRKQIRRVTTRLGDARDKDVQIAFLAGVLDALDEKGPRPGIVRMMVRWEQQRERLQPKVVKAADRFETSGVLKQMRTVSKRVLSAAKAQGLGVQSQFTFRQTEQHILGSLERLLPYQESLADPEDRERHHAMRIAAKRLRYTVEISRPVYNGQLDGTIDAIKRVQTLLGEVHDCDVWIEQLQEFAAKERRRILKLFGHAGWFARLQVGIEYLQEERRQRRRQVFRELVDYWQELGQRGEWEKLANTARARGTEPVAPRAWIEAAPERVPKAALRREESDAGGDLEDSATGPRSASW